MDFARARPATAVWQWAALLVAVALLAGAGMYWRGQWQLLELARESLEQERQLQRKQAAVAQARADRSPVAMKRIASVYGALNHSWTPVFELLENARAGTDHRVRINSVSQLLDDQGELRVSIAGTARDQNALLQYVRALGERPDAPRANLLSQRPEPGQQALSFVVEVAWSRLPSAGDASARMRN